MISTVKHSKYRQKKVVWPAVISAAFFILFFMISLAKVDLLHDNTVKAERVPLAETLDYQLVELASGNVEEIVKVAIHSESVSEAETIAIAKELNRENEQKVIVYASTKPVADQMMAKYNENIAYKVTINENQIETIQFDVYKETHPDVSTNTDWDVSNNVLDLVTGKVSVKIEMDSTWNKNTILEKAQALSEQIVAYNQESGVASVYFEIKAGEKVYLYDSEYFNTIGEYQVTQM